MAYIYKQIKFRFFEIIPLLLLFFLALNGSSVINFKFFTISLHYILVYYWVLRRPGSLGYGFIFLSGIISDVVLGFPFRDPVFVKATMKYERREIPLANVLIRTKGISPKELQGWTNGEGVANLRLPASFSDESAKSIRFEIIKSRLPDNGAGLPEASPVNLRYTVVNNLPVMFGLEFVDESGSKKAVLDAKKKITKTITGLGHMIADNDKLLLRNTITVESPKEVEGKDGTMFIRCQ